MKKFESAIVEALARYNHDNVDIVLDDENGNIDIMYHSDNNSFCIAENVCKYDDVKSDIVKLANNYGIGYVL